MGNIAQKWQNFFFLSGHHLSVTQNKERHGAAQAELGKEEREWKSNLLFQQLVVALCLVPYFSIFSSKMIWGSIQNKCHNSSYDYWIWLSLWIKMPKYWVAQNCFCCFHTMPKTDLWKRFLKKKRKPFVIHHTQHPSSPPLFWNHGLLFVFVHYSGNDQWKSERRTRAATALWFVERRQSCAAWHL